MAEEEMTAWSAGQNPSAAGATFARRDGAGDDAGIRALASELLGAMRDAGTAMLEGHKQLAAEQTAEVAEAVQRFGRSVDQTQSRVIDRYCERAAARITEAAQAMRQRRWGEIAVDAEEFARHRPAWFILAALGTGFIAGRLLMAAAERERRRLPVPVTPPPVAAPTAPAPSEGVV